MPTRNLGQCSRCCEKPYVNVTLDVLPFDYEVARRPLGSTTNYLWFRFLDDPILRFTGTRSDGSTKTVEVNALATAWTSRSSANVLIADMDYDDLSTLGVLNLNQVLGARDYTVYLPFSSPMTMTHADVYANGGYTRAGVVLSFPADGAVNTIYQGTYAGATGYATGDAFAITNYAR